MHSLRTSVSKWRLNNQITVTNNTDIGPELSSELSEIITGISERDIPVRLLSHWRWHRQHHWASLTQCNPLMSLHQIAHTHCCCLSYHLHTHTSHPRRVNHWISHEATDPISFTVKQTIHKLQTRSVNILTVSPSLSLKSSALLSMQHYYSFQFVLPRFDRICHATNCFTNTEKCYTNIFLMHPIHNWTQDISSQSNNLLRSDKQQAYNCEERHCRRL